MFKIIYEVFEKSPFYPASHRTARRRAIIYNDGKSYESKLYKNLEIDDLMAKRLKPETHGSAESVANLVEQV